MNPSCGFSRQINSTQMDDCRGELSPVIFHMRQNSRLDPTLFMNSGLTLAKLCNIHRNTRYMAWHCLEKNPNPNPRRNGKRSCVRDAWSWLFWLVFGSSGFMAWKYCAAWKPTLTWYW